MKIRLGELKKIIREEFSRTLSESADVKKLALASGGAGALPFLIVREFEKLKDESAASSVADMWDSVRDVGSLSQFLEGLASRSWGSPDYSSYYNEKSLALVMQAKGSGLDGTSLVSHWQDKKMQEKEMRAPKPSSGRDPNDPYRDVPYIGGGTSGARYTGD